MSDNDFVRLDGDMLREHIKCWDEFVTQASEAAKSTYGVEYNKWALYIPALVAELNNDIAKCVNTIDDAGAQMSMDFDADDEQVDEPPDESTQLSVGTRLKQLQTGETRTRTPNTTPRIMDPFRKMAYDAASDQSAHTSTTPDEPELTGDVWEDDPDWND